MDASRADPPSHTVDEFCALEKISRAQLYREWSKGRGPRFFLVGTRRKISEEARREWRQHLEAESQGGANADAA